MANERTVVEAIKANLAARENLDGVLRLNDYLSMALNLRRAGIEADTKTVGMAVDELKAVRGCRCGVPASESNPAGYCNADTASGSPFCLTHDKEAKTHYAQDRAMATEGGW